MVEHIYLTSEFHNCLFIEEKWKEVGRILLFFPDSKGKHVQRLQIFLFRLKSFLGLHSGLCLLA